VKVGKVSIVRQKEKKGYKYYIDGPYDSEDPEQIEALKLVLEEADIKRPYKITKAEIDSLKNLYTKGRIS